MCADKDVIFVEIILIIWKHAHVRGKFVTDAIISN